MDVSDASYYKHKNNENKGSRMGHKKIFKKRKRNVPFRRNLKEKIEF
jgi:hypothetical protein